MENVVDNPPDGRGEEDEEDREVKDKRVEEREED